jgi:hypothetical protein
LDERKAGGGGPPGADLTNPQSPRYQAVLTGVAVRLPTERIRLLQAIVESRNEKQQVAGSATKTKLSELVRHVFDLGMYELQVQEAVSRWARRNRTQSLEEIAQAVRLPLDLVRRELKARGMVLPDLVPNSADGPPPSA